MKQQGRREPSVSIPFCSWSGKMRTQKDKYKLAAVEKRSKQAASRFLRRKNVPRRTWPGLKARPLGVT